MLRSPYAARKTALIQATPADTPPDPTITSVTPSTGTVDGGIAITIVGTGFQYPASALHAYDVTAVYFAGRLASSIVVTSPTSLTCVTPPGTAGTVSVEVVAPGGRAYRDASVGGFVFTGPRVDSIAPNSGGSSGGTAVTIHGLTFTGATIVTIGGAPCSAVTVVNDTTITCVTGAHGAGTFDVNVTGPGGTGIGAGLFTYLVPIVTSVSPNMGSVNGGTAVTIHGQFLTGATSATFGGVVATSFVVVNDTTITCVTGVHAVGVVDVAVDSPNGVGVGVGLYTYSGPIVTSVSPSSGNGAGGTNVTITGQLFTGATSATIGGVALSLFDVGDDNTITGTTGAHVAGVVDVTVIGPIASGTGVGLYTYTKPSVTLVTPNNGSTAGGTSVTITGSVFTGATSAAIGGTNITSFVVVNDTTITGVTAGHVAGAVDVTVTSPGGTGTGSSLYTYVAFDPAALNLTGWWRGNYSALPWNGTGSVGNSGTHALTTAGIGQDPPTGATLNGFVPAAFDGVNKEAYTTYPASDLVSASSASVVVLFFANSAFPDSGGSTWYDMPNLCGQGGGTRFGMTFSTAGVRFGNFDGGAWQSAVAACATGAWHLAQGKLDGAVLKVRVDSGAWQSVAGGPSALSNFIMKLGADSDFNVTFFDGRIMEVMTSQQIISDADFDNIKAYVNNRYGLAL